MVRDDKAFLLGYVVLPLFNFSVIKLLNTPTVQTYQVVMVLTFIEFINSLATLKMAATENVGLLKLRQHPVHGGQAHIGAVFKQNTKYILSRHVTLCAFLEYFKYF